MPIDDCKHTFAEMADRVLPLYMERMRLALVSPHPSSSFCTKGCGLRGVLSKLGRAEDLSGCYVLVHGGIPYYVGISRKVVSRLRQHLTGSSDSNATLAYLMATEESGHDMSRKEAMKNPSFLQRFREAQQLLRNCSVAFVEISNPLELHLFEAYCAMELDTCKWNTFRTH